jgi:hypothetical protein
MEDERQDVRRVTPSTGAAAIECLTAPCHGTVSWLSPSTSDISLGPDRFIRVSETHPDEPQDHVIARLHPAENSYEIEATETRPVWVNGVRVTEHRLKHGDMIEFGKTGPLSRFCLFPEDKTVRRAVADILSDTTILFRTAVVIAIVALAALTYQQNRLNTLLNERFETDASRLDSVARAREEALSPSDLKELRQELGLQLSSNADRLAALKQLSKASARVVAESTPSVVFLQGAYGFREKSSGRMLRHVLNASGRPMMLPGGQPLLALHREGVVANRQYTGTAFAVGDGRVLIANRHVALPW